MMKKLIMILAVYCVFLTTAKSETNDSIKVYYTGEIIILSKDNQLERSSKNEEFLLNPMTTQRFITLDNPLSSIQGLRVRKNSKNESVIIMRGFDQRQIGVFFDGVPITNQFDGMIDLSNFSINSVSKIVASKGVPSILYGANNLGGSINILTDNVFSKNSGLANIQLGNQIKSYSAKISQNLDAFFITASYSNTESKNFKTSSSYNGQSQEIINSSFKNNNGFLKIAYMNNESSFYSVSLLTMNNSKDIPRNTETTKPRFWKMPEINNYILNLTHNSKISDFLSLRGNFFFIQGENILNSYDDSTYSTQKTKNAFISTQKDSKFGGFIFTEINTGLLDLTKLTISVSQDKHQEQSNTGTEWKSFESRVTTFGVEQNFSYKYFGAIVGTSYDILQPIYANGNNLRNNEISFNFNFGVNYSIENFRIFANFSQKNRFPTLKEFYAEILGAVVPNQELSSETGQNTELGINYHFSDNLKISSSLFYNNVKNLIDVAFLPDNKRQFVNIGKARFYGLETAINYKFNQYSAILAFNYLKSENISDNATTSIITLRPELTLQANISASYQFGLDFELEYLLYKKQFAYNSDKKMFFEMPDYGLLNLFIQYRIIDNIAIYSSFNNIFDVYYLSDWGYPQQGFNFSFGLKLAY